VTQPANAAWTGLPLKPDWSDRIQGRVEERICQVQEKEKSLTEKAE
jgi:hypothetical protein